MEHRLGLRLVGLCRLKPLLNGGRPLCRTLLLRPHRGHLDRSVLGLAVGGLQLTLKLGHPGMLHPVEIGLAGRHLHQTLKNEKQAC